MRIEDTIVRELQDAGDLIIPRECAVCGRRLTGPERHVCIYCEADLPLTYFWDRRENPMADRLNELIQKRIEKLCAERGTESVPRMEYARAAALFFYHGDAGYKKVPQRVKYGGDRQTGLFYGRLLGRFLKESEGFTKPDFIVPVPLHWARHWSRGYNQAEVIARGIAEVTGSELRTDILSRVRRTGTQTKLSVGQKAANVEHAFRLREGFLREEKAAYGNDRPMRIMIVDDVFTTGATMASCCAALMDHFQGKMEISAASLGFVSPE